MNDTVYWIWLSLSCTIDTGTFSKLINRFPDAKSVYDASEREIIDCIGPKLSDRSRLFNKDLTKANEIYEFCTRHSIGILKYCDEEYPKLLRKITTPPVLLYYRGKLPDFNSRPFVSVVGTRNLSEYGRKIAFNFGYDLSVAGAIVVSGMALGIDSVAHVAALASDHPTVAILGSGIDVCYPPEHLTLAREIVKVGCIMTEYPPGTQPTKYTFPKRNRIIAGISHATFVVEGKERSGSIITARYAKEYGRDLFALPGNVGAEHSEVTNLLLKDGAKPATRAEDVLKLYEKDFPDKINLFALEDRKQFNIIYVLKGYEVVANTPSDDIYNQRWIAVKNKHRPAFRRHFLQEEENIRLRKEEEARIKAPGYKYNPGSDYSFEVLRRLSDRLNAIQEAKDAERNAARAKVIQEREERRRRLGINFDIDNLPGYKRRRISESGIPAHFEPGVAGTVNIDDYNFDIDTVAVYKKIPLGGAIELEELTTEYMPLKDVLKHITKLETNRFVVMLPGGKVIRKY